MTKSILLVGVGGQGTILASKLLTMGLMEAGYDVKMSEIHGMSQRGGEYQESDIDADLSRLNAKVINAADKAEELGNSKIMNVILLGCLVKSMQLESIDWEKIISENVKPKFVELNIKAFHEGMEMVSK